tara:strand:+ start:317 stop:595 length:279 start_codon:yes stop_codon:yes gene_type:complete
MDDLDRLVIIFCIYAVGLYMLYSSHNRRHEQGSYERGLSRASSSNPKSIRGGAYFLCGSAILLSLVIYGGLWWILFLLPLLAMLFYIKFIDN